MCVKKCHKCAIFLMLCINDMNSYFILLSSLIEKAVLQGDGIQYKHVDEIDDCVHNDT